MVLNTQLIILNKISINVYTQKEYKYFVSLKIKTMNYFFPLKY